MCSLFLVFSTVVKAKVPHPQDLPCQSAADTALLGVVGEWGPLVSQRQWLATGGHTELNIRKSIQVFVIVITGTMGMGWGVGIPLCLTMG